MDDGKARFLVKECLNVLNKTLLQVCYLDVDVAEGRKSSDYRIVKKILELSNLITT